MFTFLKRKNTQRAFLDYASTTPLDRSVFKEMKKFMIKNFYNSSSLYKEGVEVAKVLDDSRGKIAKVLKVRKEDIYFTGSGTESNNLAMLGIYEKHKKDFTPHFIVSKIEHPAILETAKEIEKRGGEVSYISVDKDGLIDLNELKSVLKENTVLISIMYANNEIGTIEPISKISRIIKKFKEENKRGVGDFPYFHTDASQAPNYLDCSIDRLGVDMLTLDGSKIYGPKGIGLLYKKYFIDLYPITFGGGQEKGLRPATENVPAIVGFAEALSKASALSEVEGLRLSTLRDYMISEILNKFPQASLNGHKENRLPNNVNICFPGVNAEFEVIKLDEKGVACAAWTACKNLGDNSSSYVIEALNKKECASSSLRFTLGRETTKTIVDFAIEKIKTINTN